MASNLSKIQKINRGVVEGIRATIEAEAYSYEGTIHLIKKIITNGEAKTEKLTNK